MVAAKVGGNAVDLADVDAPAADGSTHYFQLAAAHPFQPQQGGVGVGTAQHHGADGIIQPGLLRQGKAVRDAFIVWQHAQQPGHQRTVGTVAAACGGKAAMQQDLGSFGASPNRLRAVSPMRTAPAVWLLEGPVITGPSTSNKRMTLSLLECT